MGDNGNSVRKCGEEMRTVLASGSALSQTSSCLNS